MKQIIVFLSLLIGSVLGISAQEQTAILSHDGELKFFTGVDALKSAYEVSSNGDIITLSSGQFNSPEFNKTKVSVRGVGMMPDENPTIITNIWECDNRNEDNDTPTTFEGVLFNGNRLNLHGHNYIFSKCWFNLQLELYSDLQNSDFISCYLSDHCLINGKNILFQNCILKSDDNANNISNASCTYKNCTILLGNFLPENTTLENCIIKDDNDDYNQSANLPKSSYANGCVFIGAKKGYFKNTPSTSNVVLPLGTDIFKDGSTFYELSDEAVKTYLGVDGTQVGVHGGALPFDPETSGIKVTKFNVSPKTTADGKLSVDIEVKAD